jgi:hypothetical protein
MAVCMNPDVSTFSAIDDGSEELFGGFWPFIRRAMMLFLPPWIFLLCWSAGLHNILSALIAGLSLSFVVFIERYKLRKNFRKDK